MNFIPYPIQSSGVLLRLLKSFTRSNVSYLFKKRHPFTRLAVVWHPLQDQKWFMKGSPQWDLIQDLIRCVFHHQGPIRVFSKLNARICEPLMFTRVLMVELFRRLSQNLPHSRCFVFLRKVLNFNSQGNTRVLAQARKGLEEKIIRRSSHKRTLHQDVVQKPVEMDPWKKGLLPLAPSEGISAHKDIATPLKKELP